MLISGCTICTASQTVNPLHVHSCIVSSMSVYLSVVKSYVIMLYAMI